jgi:hypothetical protein
MTNIFVNKGRNLCMSSFWTKTVKVRKKLITYSNSTLRNTFENFISTINLKNNNTVWPRLWQLIGAAEKCCYNRVLLKPDNERKIS